MQPIEQAAWGRQRANLEVVAETLAALTVEGESLAELAHDARNMVTALGLYCDLLEEPGVLADPFLHYGPELRLVASASRRLVEKMVALDTRTDPAGVSARRDQLREAATRFGRNAPQNPLVEMRPRGSRQWEMLPAVPIDNLADELLANRNLLVALAGPTIALTVETQGGALPVRLNGEDLTRVLVNLVKNAAQAMPGGGAIHLTLREIEPAQGVRPHLRLTIEDSGPGIPADALDKVFEAGFSTLSTVSSADGWPSTHRGLGLSITRSIVEAAGGRIGAANSDQGGALLTIDLPVYEPPHRR